MKKLLIFMLCMTFLTGCGNDDRTDTNNNKVSDNNTITNKDGVGNANDSVANDMENWYDNFENALEGKNVNYSTKSSIDATSIGGVEGYRYTTENGNIDVYRFVDGDEFNKIMKDKKINVDGKDAKVEVNGHMVIVSDGVSEDVLSVFRGLK